MYVPPFMPTSCIYIVQHSTSIINSISTFIQRNRDILKEIQYQQPPGDWEVVSEQLVKIFEGYGVKVYKFEAD
jgi:hypothetical protein